jgi:hypothetical protein
VACPVDNKYPPCRPCQGKSACAQSKPRVRPVHPVRHDGSGELGAFANPKGRPRRKNSAIANTA